MKINWFEIGIFGSGGTGEGEFNSPSCIATDINEDIYVTDTDNNRVQIFDSEGNFKGMIDADFDHPYGIAIDPSSYRIAISDERNHRIRVFDPEGTFLHDVGRWGGDSGEFRFPKGIAFNNEGMMFVADNNNHRVQIFNSDLSWKYRFGGYGSEQGRLKYPNDVAIDEINKRIIVVDNQNHRLQFFDMSGNNGGTIGKFGKDIIEFEAPSGICIKNASIFVCDTLNHRIQSFLFDKKNVIFTGAYGLIGIGCEQGGFYCPTGITITSRGKLIVVDTLNNRIKIVEPIYEH